MATYDYGRMISLVDPIVGGKPRHKDWPKVRRIHLRVEKLCRSCGTNSNLQVHHIKPYHKFPELELVPENLMTLCRYCHFVLGHDNHWGNWVVDVIEEVKRHYTRVLAHEPQVSPISNMPFGVSIVYTRDDVKPAKLTLREKIRRALAYEGWYPDE